MFRNAFRKSLLVLTMVLGSSLATRAQPADGMLEGRIEGNTYVSPTGLFRITVPVRPELGGDVSDTPNSVTFQDDYTYYATIVMFPLDRAERWEFQTRGAKDYLVNFFSTHILADFKETFQGARIESAKFIPGLLDGTLLTYILLPGGTMFDERVANLGAGTRLPVAKRGNLLFVKHDHVFVISMELAERAIEGSVFGKTTAEEDDILHKRLMDLLSKVAFAKQAPGEPAKNAAKK